MSDCHRQQASCGAGKSFLDNCQAWPPAMPQPLLADRPADPDQRAGHGSGRTQTAARQFMPHSTRLSGAPVEAEVVGFATAKNCILMPSDDVYGLSPPAPSVVAFETTGPSPPQIGRPAAVLRPPPRHRPRQAGTGRRTNCSAGCVDGVGRPLDNKGPVNTAAPIRCVRCKAGRSTRCLRAADSTSTLDVGIRAINSLLTVGRGQRMGLFAGSGVGKSRAARHDGPLHRGRGHCRWADRRTRTRGQGIHRTDPRRGRYAARSVVVAAPADTSVR